MTTSRVLPPDPVLRALLAEAPCAEVARRYGVSVSAVAQHARRLGADRQRTPRKMPPDGVLVLALPVLSMAEAVRCWRVSRAVVRRAAARLGLDWRGRWVPVDVLAARRAVRRLKKIGGRAAGRTARMIEVAG